MKRDCWDCKYFDRRTKCELIMFWTEEELEKKRRTISIKDIVKMLNKSCDEFEPKTK